MGKHNNNKSEQSHLYTSQNADKVSIEVLSGDASITINKWAEAFDLIY